MFNQKIIQFKMFKTVFEKSRGHMPPPLSCGRHALKISKFQLPIFVLGLPKPYHNIMSLGSHCQGYLGTYT